MYSFARFGINVSLYMSYRFLITFALQDEQFPLHCDASLPFLSHPLGALSVLRILAFFL